MKAKDLVNKLLEADQDNPDYMDPEELKRYALDAQDYLVKRQPPEIANVLEYAPKEFVDAFFKKEEATWETDNFEFEWWPSYDPDNEEYPWTKMAYYSEWRTEDGKVYQIIKDVDSGGDHDYVDEAEVGTPEWQRMREPYAYYAWVEANAEYSQWVAENGRDPLDFFIVPRVETNTEWIVAFTQDGDRARFWRARQVGDPNQRHEPIDDPNQLPQVVRDYINLDANRINQDATWADILEMVRTATNPREGPVLRRSGNVEYVQFREKFNERGQAEDADVQLRQIAMKAYAREIKDAKKARRQHKKMPHYVI